MNVREIVSRAEDYFPNLNFREVESELQRRRLIMDFFPLYLRELGVDIDSLTKIQLHQPEVAIGNDMISTINLKSSVNALIPNINLGLFELMAPSPNELWSRIDHALDFFEYADGVTMEIYELCKPFMKGKENIKHLEQVKIDKQNQIMEMNVKINHTNKQIEEINAQMLDTNNLIEETVTERILLERQIQQAIAHKTMLIRKKNQVASSVEEVKSKLSRKKNLLLDHSIDCEGKNSKLEEDLSKVVKEKEKLIVKKEEMKRDFDETKKLKEVLAQRLSTASDIFETITKYNDLKASIHDSSTTQGVTDDLNNEIDNQIQDTAKFSKMKNRELADIENKIEKNNYNNIEVEDKLRELSKKYRDLQIVKIKLEGVDSKAKKVKEAYCLKVGQLQAKEKKIIDKAKKTLNENKQLSTLEEKLKEMKSLKQ